MRGVTGLLGRRRASRQPQRPATMPVSAIPADDGRSVNEAIAAEPEREFVALRSDSPFEATGEAFRDAGGLFPTGAPPVLGAPPTAAAPVAKTGERPYADIAASQMAAYRFAAASERTGPQPEYHPVPGAAPVTAPMPVLPGNAKVPPPPAAPSVPAWTAATDREAMERTIGALREVDFTAVSAAKEQEGMTYAGVLAARAADSPAPDLSRAGRFVADMRFRGGLPLFRQTAHAVGWRGLNEDPPRTGWAQYTVGGWHKQRRAAIAAATKAAQAEIRRDASEWDRREARARSAGAL